MENKMMRNKMVINTSFHSIKNENGPLLLSIELEKKDKKTFYMTIKRK